MTIIKSKIVSGGSYEIKMKFGLPCVPETQKNLTTLKHQTILTTLKILEETAVMKI